MAGGVRTEHYRSVSINNEKYLTHRIIFLYHHGFMPEFIDHIDGDSHNNKIENLREATRINNNCNAKKRKDNTSGIKGVGWSKQRNKWMVRCQHNGQRHYVGFYDNLNDAEQAAVEFRNKHHGEFAKHD